MESLKNDEVKDILSEKKEDVSKALLVFLEKNNKTMDFSHIDFTIQQKLWAKIFGHLNEKMMAKDYVHFLSAIRILSRDKKYLDKIIQTDWIETLLDHSRLKVFETFSESDYAVLIEALKCLCNLVYNSPLVRDICSKKNVADNIIKRLLTYSNPEVPYDVKYFDMRLLFIISAFDVDVRQKLREQLNGIIYLTEFLISIIEENSEKEICTSNKVLLSDKQVDLTSEITKILFNLTMHNDTDTVNESENLYTKLVVVLQDLLMISTETPSKQFELHSHIINLLTTMPISCLKVLITTAHDNELSKDMEYEGYNMGTIFILLVFLKSKFDDTMTVPRQHELLSPILSLLIKLVQNYRIVRKYLRKQILPPLKDVHHRPEQGSTLRNCLCRLLTTPITQVRDLVAELLFILCKENVGRMIKYTGYGNAAGLFANRGLMGKYSNENSSRYSSDSEDSDTEEYNEYKHGINPVIGCYEPPHAKPTEGMSEEQKEYEAMKLVQLIDDLTKKGVMQPCRIGEDGRPHPIEHILDLQSELPKQQINEDSD